MQLFSFSSAPASLAADVLTAAEVSPIFAENFTIPIWLPSHTSNANSAAAVLAAGARLGARRLDRHRVARDILGP